MSFVRVWVHAVWGTKNRSKILLKDAREILFNHILQNAKEKQVHIDSINGYLEHVHCLVALNADSSISKTLQLIKGEASHWANQNSIVKPKLEWADDYFASSVSESNLQKVRDYINNQEQHHRTSTFEEEYQKFLKGFDQEKLQG